MPKPGPAPSVGKAMSVARSWSTMVMAADRVILLSRSAFTKSHVVPWTSIPSLRAALVPARSSMIAVPPWTRAHASTADSPLL